MSLLKTARQKAETASTDVARSSNEDVGDIVSGIPLAVPVLLALVSLSLVPTTVDKVGLWETCETSSSCEIASSFVGF